MHILVIEEVVITTSPEVDNGITPFVDTHPIVVFRPTMAFREAGEIIDPSVSVPNDTVTIFVDTDTAEPVLEPDGSASITYADTVCPPRPLHPFGAFISLNLKHL